VRDENGDIKWPRDLDAEIDLLGRIYEADGGQIHLVADSLRPQQFFNRRNEHVYAAALALVDAGQPVTIGGAHAWLTDRQLIGIREGGMGGPTVRELLMVDIPFHVSKLSTEKAALRIRQKYALRQVIMAATRVATEATGDVGEVEQFCENAEASLHAVTRELNEGLPDADVFSIFDLTTEYAKEMQNGATRDFVTTGLPDLDEDLGGLEYGFVTVIGAPTNWGKSNVVIMIADEADLAGKRVLVVSFEDKPQLYGKRFIVRRNSLSAGRFKDYRLNVEEMSRLTGFCETANANFRAPFVLRANGRPIENVMRRVHRICQTNKIDAIVYDYLQAAKCKERVRDKRERVEFCFREMVDGTKQIGAAGVVISQFRRLEQGEEPTLHHLKESGDIENGAECVLLGFNDSGGYPRLRLAKSKDGLKNYDYGLVWDPVAACFRSGSRIEQRLGSKGRVA
jgi:replicative DNA helicase